MASKAQVNPTSPRWLEVLGVSMPLCLSYIPIGLACGILLHAAGFNFVMTFLVSILVFSGGAQFTLASMMTIGAPLATIFTSLFFLELRYAILGPSLSKYIKNESSKFLFIFSFSMNDENYAVNYMKFATDKKWKPDDALLVEWYTLISWTLSNMVGALIGSAVAINLEIVDFALTALFIYMIVVQLQSHLLVLISVLSGVLSIFCFVWTKNTLGLIIATLVASFVGFLIENTIRHHSKDPKNNWLLSKPFRPKATRITVEDQEAEKRYDQERKQQENASHQLSDGSKHNS